MEKIGTPVAVDEATSTTSTTTTAPQAQATNSYGQAQHQPQQQVQQSRPSQYVLGVYFANDSGNAVVYPIEGLSPYQNKYVPCLEVG